MSEIEVVLRTQRRDNKQRLVCTWTEPIILAEVAPDPLLRRESFVEAPAIETVINNVNQMSIASTNTDVVAQVGRGMRHFDGGWPNNVDVEEREARAKHCKKVEREEGYLAACIALTHTAKPFLRLNATIDIFEIYNRFNSCSPGDKIVDGATGSHDDVPIVRGEMPSDSSCGAAASSPPSTAAVPLSVTMKFAAPRGDLRVTQVAFTCGSDADQMVVGYIESSPGADGWYNAPVVSTDTAVIAAAVWSLSSCVAPAHTLLSRVGGCTAVATCPKDPHQIVGGSANGIVQLWDLRRHPEGQHDNTVATMHLPVACSKRLSSHRDAVTEAKYILSKGIDVMTCSIDGRILFWDLDNLSEPLHDETLELLLLPNGGRSDAATPSIAVSSPSAVAPLTASNDSDDDETEDPLEKATLTACHLDYDPMVGGVQQYLVGTAEGVVLACTRKGKRKSDRILHRYQASLSSVFMTQRCAVLPKVFLTVGDWGWRLFGDEVATPIMSSAPRLRQVTCGHWHTTRPSIVLTGTACGRLEIWDLIGGGVTAPVNEIKVSDAPLLHCVPHANGKSVAVSDASGHVYLLHLPEEYSVPSPKERVTVVTALEREFNRERSLQSQHTSDTNAPIAKPVEERDAVPFGMVDACNDGETVDALTRLTQHYLMLTNDEEEGFGKSTMRASSVDLLHLGKRPAVPTRDVQMAASRSGSLALSSSAPNGETGRRRSSEYVGVPAALDTTVCFDAMEPEAQWVPTSTKKPTAPNGKPRMGRF